MCSLKRIGLRNDSRINLYPNSGPIFPRVVAIEASASSMCRVRFQARLLDHIEHRAPVGALRLVEERRYGGAKFRVLVRRQRDDLAAFFFDRRARLAVFLDGEAAVKF